MARRKRSGEKKRPVDGSQIQNRKAQSDKSWLDLATSAGRARRTLELAVSDDEATNTTLNAILVAFRKARMDVCADEFLPVPIDGVALRDKLSEWDLVNFVLTVRGEIKTYLETTADRPQTIWRRESRFDVDVVTKIQAETPERGLMRHELRAVALVLDIDESKLRAKATGVSATDAVEKLINVAVPCWLEQLLTLQSAETGGFRTKNQRPTQVWTTAICVAAIASLACAGTHTQKLRRACEGYIEGARSQELDGWGYFENIPFAMTEITGWVVVAYSKLLRLTSKDTLLPWICRELSVLRSRQVPCGGFCPTNVVINENVRAYSTAMATWALTEALQLDTVRDTDTKNDLLGVLRKGVDWFCANYRSQSGWYSGATDVQQRTSDVAWGLNAQILYVLTTLDGVSTNCELLSEVGSALNDHAVYKKAINQFLDVVENTLQTCAYTEGDTVASDCFLQQTDGTICTHLEGV